MKESLLTAERLRARFDYDATTGVFTRRFCTVNRHPAGAIVGSVNHDGYARIEIDRVGYQAHRLAWLYAYGAWPVGCIDHINGVRNDNRITNLRDVTPQVNSQNLRSAHGRSRSGLLGAQASGPGTWQSSIKQNGKSVYLGSFATAELAHAAYVAAKRQLHEGNTL